jgi:hypothetical protein
MQGYAMRMGFLVGDLTNALLKIIKSGFYSLHLHLLMRPIVGILC